MSANVFIRSALSTCTLAVAQYLPRVGIKTTADAMTRSVYFPRRALTTVVPAAREKRLQEPMTLALADLPSVPLHFESSIWAFRKGLTYEGRADQYSLAMSAWPAQ